MPAGVAPPPDQAIAMPGPPAPVAPIGMGDQGDGTADGRRTKRELSQSKRAAQNRAAQVSDQPCVTLAQPIRPLRTPPVYYNFLRLT